MLLNDFVEEKRVRRFISYLFYGFIGAVTVCQSASAEYRVYLLTLTDTQTNQVRSFTSTLDDLQYRGYYPIKAGVELVLTDTWMCWGRHGDFQALCRNPRSIPTTGSPR
jgi:hypothetical protein